MGICQIDTILTMLITEGFKEACVSDPMYNQITSVWRVRALDSGESRGNPNNEASATPTIRKEETHLEKNIKSINK